MWPLESLCDLKCEQGEPAPRRRPQRTQQRDEKIREEVGVYWKPSKTPAPRIHQRGAAIFNVEPRPGVYLKRVKTQGVRIHQEPYTPG